MKVSLLFTQTGMDNANFGVQKFRDQNIGIIPPVSLLNVASILEKIDVEVSIIDVDAENLSYPKVLRRISEFSPDLIGFSIISPDGLAINPLMPANCFNCAADPLAPE